MQDQNLALVHAFVLDGRGGARSLVYEELDGLTLAADETLWLHWDRGQDSTQQWLRESSGLNEFVCDLLLEENTRPRLVPLPDNQMLLFLRGINCNPGEEPEDMVSVRIFAESRRVITLRLRPLRATEPIIAELATGKGPINAADLLLSLADYMTDKVDELIVDLVEVIDDQEDRIDSDQQTIQLSNPSNNQDHAEILQLRRRAASLRRFLSPQRELYAQLARTRQSWFLSDNEGYWSELANRLTRYLEELELIRERVGLILESENRRLNVRMNRIMYRFSIITALFLPLTFITGLLGVNVGGIPGAESPWGFLATCGLTVILVGLQILLFRWWKWL